MGGSDKVKFRKPAKWVPLSDGEIPDNAVEGGQDGDDMMYVGMAEHEGSMTPGKIHPGHGCCYIAWGGEEHAKQEYKALSNKSECQLDWIPASYGAVPSGALQGGYTEDGEDLFIGRAYHEDAWVIGKVQQSHEACYVPYGGSEHAKQEYEVLCAKVINFKSK